MGATKFVKRQLSFLRPEKDFFCRLLLESQQAAVYSRVAMLLIGHLLASDEGAEYLGVRLISKIAAAIQRYLERPSTRRRRLGTESGLAMHLQDGGGKEGVGGEATPHGGSPEERRAGGTGGGGGGMMDKLFGGWRDKSSDGKGPRGERSPAKSIDGKSTLGERSPGKSPDCEKQDKDDKDDEDSDDDAAGGYEPHALVEACNPIW